MFAHMLHRIEQPSPPLAQRCSSRAGAFFLSFDAVTAINDYCECHGVAVKILNDGRCWQFRYTGGRRLILEWWPCNGRYVIAQNSQEKPKKFTQDYAEIIGVIESLSQPIRRDPGRRKHSTTTSVAVPKKHDGCPWSLRRSSRTIRQERLLGQGGSGADTVSDGLAPPESPPAAETHCLTPDRPAPSGLPDESLARNGTRFSGGYYRQSFRPGRRIKPFGMCM